jgi:hypothetical protein
MPSASPLRDPVDRLRELPRDLRLLRVAEVEAVGEPSGSPPAHATLRAAPTRPPPPRERVALAERRPCERDGEPAQRRPQPQHRASSPGRRTVREPTSWSYCS